MIEHEQIPKEKKVGFTGGQREFVKRAYREVLGFAGCVFPIWNEVEGEYRYCKSLVKINIHHIKPRGHCIRVLHIDPNVPENASVLCQEHHTDGQKNKPITREDQECIHIDSAWATKNYKGKTKPTTFDRVADQRKRLTDEQKIYWATRWDTYFSELAADVMQEFMRRHPENLWP